MSCWQTVQDYAFRALGFGERLLPRDDFTLCQQFTLIGSGMLWNIYFGVVALAFVTAAWLGALIVLFCNTSAYAGEIFCGALQSIPKGDVEAADAYGLSGWNRFKRVIWPTTLRLAWPAYTNEAIFLFHATTLVFVSSFPAWQQRGDALYYAKYFADKTFNPFVPYPILAGYFIVLTLCVIGVFGLVNRRLNRHLPQDARPKLRLRPNLIR